MFGAAFLALAVCIFDAFTSHNGHDGPRLHHVPFAV